MKGFSVPYRYDRYGKDGGLLLYSREDIQSNLLISKPKCNIEILSVVVNLRSAHVSFSKTISKHLECFNRLINYQPAYLPT